MISSIGEHQGLGVTIDTYEPSVTCQPEMSIHPDLADCEVLLQSMPVSQDLQVFGPEGDLDVEVVLPFELVGRKLSPSLF